MKPILYSLIFGLAALSAIVALQFRSIDTSRAQSRTNNLHTWHTVICFLEDTTTASKKETAAQKHEAIAFWDGLLVRIGAPACSSRP